MDASDLAAVRDPDVNMCIWHRQVPAALHDELAPLAPGDLPDVRRRISTTGCHGEVARVLAAHGLDPGACPHWIEDIALLARLFSGLIDTDAMALRLETSTGDGCRRFHVDQVGLRLVCTYRGPGTEWLGNDEVARSALYAGASNGAICRTHTPRRLSAPDVAIMKGERFPGNEGNGLVHRSPPLRGSGRTRVLLCLDALPRQA
ncbi:DUF1826 domain-containing protein [Arhodomonas aquaeolei]|uniref:DUF1826 domain-containing protein n=1 Tax=Arhodomonas aquaeolei TaxID=2369 RepID=UPI00036CC07B|nr:DUF1826 domain-containing protein [Arhodomonas aquaeolei]